MPASIPWYQTVIEHVIAWPWGALLPAGAVGGVIGYVAKRKIEKTGESEELTKLSGYAALHKQLREQEITLDDLKQFRSAVNEEQVRKNVDTAQHYIDRASDLAEKPRALFSIARVERTTDVQDEESEASPFMGDTQTDMNAYARDQLSQAERVLQNVVLEQTQTMGEAELDAFNTAQAAWLEWRQREAEWESRVWEGGTIRPLMVLTRMEALTRERISAIKVSGELEADTRLTIPLRPTPRDLFTHVVPGLSVERAREILGPPHYMSAYSWIYRFRESQLDLSIEEGAVRSVVLCVVEGEQFALDFVMLDLTLGVSTFADLIATTDDGVRIEHRSSARTSEIYACVRDGSPSVYQDFYFGALDALHGNGRLLNTSFEWDGQRLVSDPAETLINWVGLSGGIEAPYFSWFIN